MSHKSFSRFRLISIAIFVAGVVSIGFAYSFRPGQGPAQRQRKGFTLRTKTTTAPTTPRETGPREGVSSQTIKYQKSDGTFKQVTTYYNADGAVVKKQIVLGIPGQGVFGINNPQGPLDFLSAMPPKEKSSYVTVDDGHRQPNFVRDDWVQGYKTYVLRFPDQDGGYLELYCAPEFDGQPIKEVNVSAGSTSITELVQITLGDPDDRAFGRLPKTLISYDLFKQKIAAMEAIGKNDAAKAMQRELDEQIAKQ
ncbi:MAG TPA: hypothetical protein VJM12_20440 [Pyrinomonadaceae bacterium]|nr:hypothetical protein [Pyrinomonadaceae bacterium]